MQSISLAGMGNAVLLPSGTIVIFGLQPNAGGVIAVPAAILNQLGDNDVSIVLFAQGLAIGSTLTGTISYHPPVAAAEGVFIQTFGASGVAVSPNLVLTGTSGDDLLVGDVGNDNLSPLGGNNVLTGGAGADVFHFANILGATNRITDFQPGVDRIDLSAIDAKTTVAGDDVFTFVGSQPFSGAAGELRIEVSNGETILSGDTNGDGTADFNIIFAGQPLLAPTDFIL